MDALIAEVKKRDALWNKRNPLYKDRFSKENDWDVIATNIGIPKDYAKKRWRHLRDQFLKEMKKMPKFKYGYPHDIGAHYRGKWQYFNSLTFLKDAAVPTETDSWIPMAYGEEIELKTENENAYENSSYNETTSEVEASFIPHIQIFERPDSSNKTQNHANNKKRFRNHDKEQSRRESKMKKIAFTDNADDDIHMLFFRSLLPYMRKLDCVQQLHVRSKFQEILMKEMQTNLNSFVAGASSRAVDSDTSDESRSVSPTITNNMQDNDTMFAEQNDSNN